MMRRAPIKPRSRIFIGCEGESERSYIRLLYEYASQAGRPVHLDAVLLQPGGGDAGAILSKAIKHRGLRRQSHGAYEKSFTLLDTDKLGGHSIASLEQRAQKAGIILIWQEPCHEAFLLRHFPGRQLRHPAKAEAEQALEKLLPIYAKGMSAVQLKPHISLDMMRQAASVTPFFKALLDLIFFH